MESTKYEPVIGLEIHAELQTESKMFCSCSADYANATEPNTLICPVCTAQPGTLPVVNRRAVEQGIQVALALHCTIPPINVFARKNYYYPDLPKGYQISQYEMPLAVNGWVDVTAKGESLPQRIRVRRVHLEEDTAKLFHQGAISLIDFNRAGIPLLEIVSEPDIHSVETALAYAMHIRDILRYLEVNSGDMEKGILRFEANVSVRPAGSEEMRTRTEIKNLNSFRALTRAISYEIRRQIAVYESGGQIVQETLGWDETRQVTVSQRGKEYAHDYRYFPEPDIPPLEIRKEWVDELCARLPELPEARLQRFIEEHGLSVGDARILVAEKALADYFEAVLAQTQVSAREVANWMVGEFLRHLHERQLEVEAVPFPPPSMAELLNLVNQRIITAATAKEILREMFASGEPPQRIVQARGLGQISDADLLFSLVEQVLQENPQVVESYFKGKETVFQWLMGQIVRATHGKADPQLTRRLLHERLEARRNKLGEN
ncbi:MAG: Asp-tRNA(Asn)/Glu-tRNA(Gln) amidotransferase subunit GatB [Anaerolineales bacterium]|nr:Asp-tRNA(Asn)/Glu-tRNA(Gln) amidotransferase subunit GatB [Anaerolineales bacterium]